MSYTLGIDYYDSGNWMETGDSSETFDDLDEAIQQSENVKNGDYTPGEYRSIVTDDDGNEVYRYEWKIDPDQDMFDSSTWIVIDEGDYSTKYYGIGENGEYLHTVQNGGSKGAYSRQNGDGRWSNMSDEVNEISLADLLRAIIKSESGNIIDAAKKISNIHPSIDVDDIILDVVDDWDWNDDEKESVFEWIENENPVYGDEIKNKINNIEK